jgi:hypothetical protein
MKCQRSGNNTNQSLTSVQYAALNLQYFFTAAQVVASRIIGNEFLGAPQLHLKMAANPTETQISKESGLNIVRMVCLKRQGQRTLKQL